MEHLRINGHSHLLPYPEDIPTILKEKKIFWIDDERKFMHQANWKRPITDPSFFLNEKIEWMNKHSIDHCVVMNLSQLYGNGLEIEDMKVALRFQNDFNANIQNTYPEKFTCGFVVYAGYIDGALKEIKRCVEKLNLQLLCLPTHYLDQKGNWRNIFNEETAPIFEMANQYELAIEIHPYDGEKFIQLENKAWRFHLVWMLAQCADAYHFFSLEAWYKKYPNIRVCFAHGGQLNHMNIGRRTQAFDGRPDLFEGMERPKKAVGQPSIFFDTLVHDTLSLELMIKRLKGTDQIVMGLDDPYPLGEMECEVQNSYPGKLLDLAVEEGIINKQQQSEIWSNNVVKWIGGNKKDKLLQRLTKISSNEN